MVAVAVAAAASAYYVVAVLPAAQSLSTTLSMGQTSTTTQTTASSVSSSSIGGMMSTVSPSSTTSSSMASSTSSSTQSSVQSSSREAANLTMPSGRVSHKLGGADVAATCGPTMPSQGASYLVVTNSGTAPAEIKAITFSYVEMMTSSGAPTGQCTVGVGATEYITLTGVGADPATAGGLFTVALSWGTSGYSSLEGTFV